MSRTQTDPRVLVARAVKPGPLEPLSMVYGPMSGESIAELLEWCCDRRLRARVTHSEYRTEHDQTGVVGEVYKNDERRWVWWLDGEAVR